MIELLVFIFSLRQMWGKLNSDQNCSMRGTEVSSLPPEPFFSLEMAPVPYWY